MNDSPSSRMAYFERRLAEMEQEGARFQAEMEQEGARFRADTEAEHARLAAELARVVTAQAHLVAEIKRLDDEILTVKQQNADRMQYAMSVLWEHVAQAIGKRCAPSEIDALRVELNTLVFLLGL